MVEGPITAGVVWEQAWGPASQEGGARGCVMPPSLSALQLGDELKQHLTRTLSENYGQPGAMQITASVDRLQQDVSPSRGVGGHAGVGSVLTLPLLCVAMWPWASCLPSSCFTGCEHDVCVHV